MTVAPNPNGNDSIYITDGYTTLATTNTVEVQDGCTLTLEPNVQLVVCAGANLIIDGGSEVIKEAGSSIDVEPGGTLTGIGSGGGNPSPSSTVVVQKRFFCRQFDLDERMRLEKSM